MTDSAGNTLPYIDRDVSWMYFNHRILQEAMRENVPLLERLSFLGIYSNNLDEFFRVRMATLARLATMGGKNYAREKEKAGQLLGRIGNMDKEFSLEYEGAIKAVEKALDENGILLLNENQLTDDQRHYLKCMFRKDISGFVSPIWLDKMSELSRENDEKIFLAIAITHPSGKDEYALIELPTSLCGRFIPLPDREGKKCLIYLDDVIRMALPMIFPDHNDCTFNAYSFKFTKDAEM